MDREKSVLSGVLGGLVGGLAFGAMMGMMGMLPMVAQMVGSSSAVVGFGLHLLISAFIGGAYGLMIGHRSHALGTSLLLGAVYGLLWWVLGPLTLMPAFLGMGIGVNWNLAAASAAMPSLMGHLVYGLLLSATHYKLDRVESCPACEAMQV